MNVPLTPQDVPPSSLLLRPDLSCAPGWGPGTARTETLHVALKSPCTGQQDPLEPVWCFQSGFWFSSPHNPHPSHEDRALGVAGTAAATPNTKGNAPSHRAKWNNSNWENLDKSLIRKTDSICNVSLFSPCINPFAINLPPLKKPAFLTKPTQGSHYFNQLEGFNTLLIFRRIEKAPVLSPGCLFFLYMTFRYLWKIIPIMKSAIYCFKVQSVVTLESTCSWILLVGLCAQESAERKDFNQRAIAWNLLRNSYLSPLDFLLFKSTADTLWNETAISPM